MNDMKNELSKKPKYKNKELDKKTEEFINSIEEKLASMDEIRNYYKNKEYKKDNFEKGKILSEKYDKFFHEFRKTTYVVMKNSISVLNNKTGKSILYNKLKVNLLCEIFRDKFYGSKLSIDTSNLLL